MKKELFIEFKWIDKSRLSMYDDNFRKSIIFINTIYTNNLDIIMSRLSLIESTMNNIIENPSYHNTSIICKYDDNMVEDIVTKESQNKSFYHEFLCNILPFIYKMDYEILIVDYFNYPPNKRCFENQYYQELNQGTFIGRLKYHPLKSRFIIKAAYYYLISFHNNYIVSTRMVI